MWIHKIKIQKLPLSFANYQTFLSFLVFASLIFTKCEVTFGTPCIWRVRRRRSLCAKNWKFVFSTSIVHYVLYKRFNRNWEPNSHFTLKLKCTNISYVCLTVAWKPVDLKYFKMMAITEEKKKRPKRFDRINASECW